MNKKLMSFVLAAVLAISLGSSSAFARTDVGMAGAGLGADDNGVVMTIDYDSQMKQFAESTKGDLVTMFGYAAGTMTYAANKTSLTFYDSNGFRAGYSVTQNESTGKYNYTLTGLSLNSNDYAKIQKEYNGNLKSYLTDGLHVNPDALKTAATKEFKVTVDGKEKTVTKFVDENGDAVDSPEKAAKVDAAWLTQGVDGGANALTWLSNGVNHSMTISLGGQEPTITLAENGKNSVVIGSNAGKAYNKQTYVYNAAGFNTKIINVELVDTSASDKQAQYELQYSVTVMDEKGRQSYVFKADKNLNPIEFTKKEAKVEDNKISYVDKKDKDGNVEKGSGHIQDFHYSANGSLASYTDNTTGNTTHYVGGMQSYVTNAEGAMISQYTYSNGIMQMAQSFNNGVAINTTVFDPFGRQLGTVNGDVTYSKAVNAIKNVLNGTTNLGLSSGANSCIVQSVNIYKDYLEAGSPYSNFITSNSDLSLSFANKTYGYVSSVGSIQITTGEEGGTLQVKDNEQKNATKGSRNEEKSIAGTYKVTVNGEEKEITIKSEGDLAYLNWDDAVALCTAAGIPTSNLMVIDEDKTNSDSNTEGRTYYKQATKDNWKKSGKVYLYSTDTAAAKQVFETLGLKVSDNFKLNTQHQKVWTYLLGAKYDAKVETETTDEYEHIATAKLTTTYSIQGISIGQKDFYAGQRERFVKQVTRDTGNVTAKTANEIDPAVVGTVNRVETINGKQYAVLENAQVDLADGKGFQSAAGEEMYVCIDDLSDEEIANLQPGKTFAAAGYIDTSADGHYAINNLYAHEISSSDVQNMVQSFATTLAGNAEYQANVQMNMVTFAKAAADGKTYQDWKGGWQLLIEYGGGAPALF